MSGGSEANESAFKFARQYWLERGQPERWRIIGRWPSFHGNTLATLSAGWHVARRKRNAPLLLGFPHIETPNGYRGCGHCRERWGLHARLCPRAGTDLDRGGAGNGSGVHRRAGRRGCSRRARCSRLAIFAPSARSVTATTSSSSPTRCSLVSAGWEPGSVCEHFGVQPDILVFAKGSRRATPRSAGSRPGPRYRSLPAGSGRFEHNFTYAGHPVAVAVGAAVVKILRRDRLVERVAKLEQHFFGCPQRKPRRSRIGGDIRGMGFLAGVELVADRAHQAPLPCRRRDRCPCGRLLFGRGGRRVSVRGGVDGESGDYLLLMPPFVTRHRGSRAMAERTGRAIARLRRDLVNHIRYPGGRTR